MSAEKYVKDAVRQVKEWLAKRNQTLKSKAPSVLPSGYRPELNATELCNEDNASYFSLVIGILRWAMELGWIDICTKVSMMALFIAAPRTGHLHAVLHVFAYLNSHDRSRLVFDAKSLTTKLPEWLIGVDIIQT